MTPIMQANRKCVSNELNSTLVIRCVLVHEPTSGGKIRKPKTENPLLKRWPNSNDRPNTCSFMARPNGNPRATPANELSIINAIPNPFVNSPLKIENKGTRRSDAIPNQGNHFDFSNFFKNSNSMENGYHIMFPVAIKAVINLRHFNGEKYQLDIHRTATKSA